MDSSAMMPGLFVAVCLLTCLASGLWIWASLFLTGLLTLALFTDITVINLSSTLVWNSVNSYGLVALPLFVLMGEILLRSGISRRMFSALAPWTNKLPGGLLHTNIVASTLFAAVSGSSAATAATVGKITLPELKKRGYDDKLAIGSLAGAGTLGFLIPPSMILIVYGVMAEVSVGKLFIAGIIPGLLLASTFSLWVSLRQLASKTKLNSHPESEAPFDFKAALTGLWGLTPVFILIVAVMGSIYTGLATATESAAIGVFGATMLGLFSRELTWSELKESASQALYTCSMIGLILASAAVLSTAVELTGLPKELALGVSSLELNPIMTMIALGMLYFVLGMFLDGISMVVVTLPVVLPVVVHAGYSPLWFGVFLVIMVELAQITPPVGFNLFVLQSLTGKSVIWIARAALPFFLILFGFAILIAIFPDLVTFLVPDI